MTILVDGSVLRTGRNHSKCVVWCKFCWNSHEILLYDIVTVRGRRRTLCGFWGVEVRFSWQAQGIVRLRGVTEVIFRGRGSALCALDVWPRKDSWQVQGIVRLWVAVEVNVAVTLGLACERMLFGGAGIAKLLGRVAWCVCAPMGVSAWLLEEVSYEMIVLQTLTCEFLRKTRRKRSFWRFDAQPSAEIVRVECAKCRRECDLSHARATLCGDRACRVREMQARVQFVPCARNPLRRSCASSARNAGQSAICPVPAQPSAEIVRVECAKCRRECDFSGARATLCGDRACRSREMQARVLQECPTRVSYESVP